MPRKRHRLEVELGRFDMARGHDGFLRGHPEPALLLGHLLARGGRLVLRERLLVRFRPRGSYPLIAPATGPTRMRSLFGGLADHLLLVMALEEDSGDDVRRLYALLEDTARLSLWEADADLPAPVPLLAAARWTGGPRRVRILDGSRDLADGCHADTLVDCVLVPLDHGLRREQLRVSFRSDDARNDWSATVHVALSGR